MKKAESITVLPVDVLSAPEAPATEAGALPTVEELQQQVAVLNEKITALEEHISISDAENERLLATLKKLEESGRTLESLAADTPGLRVVLPTFEHAKKPYRFTSAQFKLDGKVVTAQAAAQNPELLKRLVDMKAGCIVAIN